MWSHVSAYHAGFRDVIGLELPEYALYQAWEDASRCGGFRVMHEKFCMVCDFPEILTVDEENRPHGETGPSHRWRDGWSLWHWHGVRIPDHWIPNRDTLDPAEVLAHENVEVRAAGAEIVGWARMAEALNRRVLDGDPDTDIGALVEMDLDGLDVPGRFLMAQCPRNGTICEEVPRYTDDTGMAAFDEEGRGRVPIDTAIAAQAWRDGLPVSEYQHPAIRT